MCPTAMTVEGRLATARRRARAISTAGVLAAVVFTLNVFPLAHASPLRVRPLNPPGGCLAPIGIAPGYTLQEADADLARDLTAARDLGATKYRFDVDWSVVEPEKGVFNWEPVDRVLAAVRAAGLEPLGVLAYTPPWARIAGSKDTHGAPADPADFATFAGRAAAQYANDIHDWEIWNEPNKDLFWAPKPDPVAYTALLKLSYAAIKGAQPSANVLAGALAPGEDGARGEVDPLTFLRSMYDSGAGGSFDAVSVHPYTYPALPTDPTTASWSTFQKMPRLRDLMVARGDAGKSIWITEFGAPTGTASNAVSPAAQATYLTDGIEAARQLDYVDAILIYSIRDSGTNPAEVEDNFGLLTKGFDPKPAYAAVQTLARQSHC